MKKYQSNLESDFISFFPAIIFGPAFLAPFPIGVISFDITSDWAGDLC